jgi:hypothetical protein
VPVPALVGRLPGLAGVGAEGRPATPSLVGALGHLRVPGERMHIPLGSRAVVLPALAAVARTHQAAELDSNQEQVRIVRAGRDPAHVGRPRPRREAPGRPRRQFEQRLQLAPARALVVALEEAARLGARIHRPIGRADREGEDAGLRQSAIDPARPGVDRAPDATLAQAGVDDVGIVGIDGEALRAAPGQAQLDRPAPGRLLEPGDPVSGRRVQPLHLDSRSSPASDPQPLSGLKFACAASCQR